MSVIFFWLSYWHFCFGRSIWPKWILEIEVFVKKLIKIEALRCTRIQNLHRNCRYKNPNSQSSSLEYKTRSSRSQKHLPATPTATPIFPKHNTCYCPAATKHLQVHHFGDERKNRRTTSLWNRRQSLGAADELVTERAEPSNFVSEVEARWRRRQLQGFCGDTRDAATWRWLRRRWKR